MKFNQSEIIEIKKISASLNTPMSFKIDNDNSIDYDFSNNKAIMSVIRKTESEFSFYGTDSNGENFSYKTDNFNQLIYHIRNFVKAIKRDNPYEIYRKKNIEELSDNFYQIFQEATIIDELGFKDSSGMIFRKALEIIVKDFLKKYLPDSFENFITEKTIGKILWSFYEKKDGKLNIRRNTKNKDINQELEKIKPLSKVINNTFEIGNDFSHYERRLLKFSTKDMKDNIIKILEFIDNNLEELNIQNKQKELDKDFNSDKLITKKH